MEKKKVFIAVHQLNLGGVQKALISALNAIDYNKNEVTLYVRRDRIDLLDAVNDRVSRIIVNSDKTRYHLRPYPLFLQARIKVAELFGIDARRPREKLSSYISISREKHEYKYNLSDLPEYDVAIAYIQSHTARLVSECVKARRKIMFFHGSKDEHHDINEKAMASYNTICCVSEPALEAVKGFYPQFAQKMRCLENYVDPISVRKLADGYDPGYPDGKLILCSCGRITDVKGFDLAVKAAAIIKDNGLDFKWYFVGDGPERSRIEELIRSLGLENDIVITGLKDNPYPYIKSCDIYVQPSYEEAHPLSIIEARILLRPVVSTATAGAKSIITDNEDGLLANIDSSSLSEKIVSIARDWKSCNRITDILSHKDYSADLLRFERRWAELLGDQ